MEVRSINAGLVLRAIEKNVRKWGQIFILDK